MNVERLLGSLLTGGMGGGSKKRRRSSSMLGAAGVGKAQVGVGLLGVAFAAFEHYQQKQTAAPSQSPSVPPPPPLPAAAAQPGTPPPPPPPPASPTGTQREADLMLVLELMIAAAHADGLLDAEERSTILERGMQLELSKGDRQQLFTVMEKPPSVAELATRSRSEIAPDLYAAAVLAITVDTDSERQWLQSLAAAIGLQPAECSQIEQSLSE